MTKRSSATSDVEMLRRQLAEFTRERDSLAEEVAELRVSEARFRAIVNSATNGVHVSQHGMTKFVNDSLLKMSGYTRQELAGFNFAEFVHPDDRKIVFDRHVRRTRGEDVETHYVFRALAKSGEILLVETTSVLIEWEGEPASLNFLRDVTQQHRAKAERHRSRRLEAIGTLAGGIAHDFNNILGQIIGFTDLARYSAEPTSRTTEHLEHVMQASTRARDLVQRILLVDDEEALVDLGVQLLEKFGYRVTGCTSAGEALTTFEKAPRSFDLVITDLTMPELTGDRLATKLLAIRPDLPVILVTGYSERMDRKKALASGFAAYLNKPLDLPELTRTMRLALGEDLPD